MLTTEEALEYMTVEQMMMTRQRQALIERESAKEAKQRLDAEYWALEHLILSDEELDEEQLQDLKTAIINNEPPEVS